MGFNSTIKLSSFIVLVRLFLKNYLPSSRAIKIIIIKTIIVSIMVRDSSRLMTFLISIRPSSILKTLYNKLDDSANGKLVHIIH